MGDVHQLRRHPDRHRTCPWCLGDVLHGPIEAQAGALHGEGDVVADVSAPELCALSSWSLIAGGLIDGCGWEGLQEDVVSLNREALVDGECFLSGPGELPMGHGVDEHLAVSGFIGR